MKILLTGFEPFGEHTVNPSQLLLEALPGQLNNHTINKILLPVHHKHGPEILLDQFLDVKPESVLSFGLAAGRTKISLERVAINLMDYTSADNADVTIVNQPIIENGPAAYFSTLPLTRLLAALSREDIPAELSLSAGAYLCNQVFYTLMHTIAVQGLSVQAGFIHLPALPEQAAHSKKPIPSMSMDLITKAALLMVGELGHSTKA